MYEHTRHSLKLYKLSNFIQQNNLDHSINQSMHGSLTENNLWKVERMTLNKEKKGKERSTAEMKPEKKQTKGSIIYYLSTNESICISRNYAAK